MAVTSEMVKQLRDKTGAGMMDCKKALDESNGDIEKAIEILRKKGAATAAKRADKAANEGIIVAKVSDDGRRGIVLEINCETDFVARGEDFVNYANTVASIIQEKNPSDVAQLMAMQYPGGKTVADVFNDLITKIGERTEIKRFVVMDTTTGFIESYTHMGSKIAVLVELTAELSPAHRTLARDIAMQVTAMNPIVVSREHVAKTMIEKELDIYRQQAKNEGKPDQIADKIAHGRLEKYFQEAVLLEQSFIKDAGKTVKDLLSPGISVKQFIRYQLGESH
jgi:elongation factor Ts